MISKLKQVFATVKRSSPILYTIVLLHFIMAAICVIGLLVDDRMLMGVNVWLKPLKFCISGGVFILTVGYLITFYPFSKRKKDIVNNITAWTMLFEIGIIVVQGVRGVQSHYNSSTLLDGLLFAAMGILVAVNVLVMVFFIIETIRLKINTTRPVQIAILMGWVIIFFGSWIGGQMIEQLSHNVGVADGGVGLPLTNWSTIAGDLRVAHFFGLHGLQLVPFFAVWIGSKSKVSARNQMIAVVVFGLLYAGWIAFTYYQAKQGLPLIRL